MPIPRTPLLIAAIAAVAVVGFLVWRSASAEPMAGFRDFPYTYVTEEAAGYDATAVVIGRGSITGEPSVADPASGKRAWPAYYDPSGTVIPPQDGQPFLVPLIAAGNGVRTPRIAPLGRPLTGQEIERLVRYQTPEGAERLDAFRKEYSP